MKKNLPIFILVFVTLVTLSAFISPGNAAYTHQDLTITVLINGSEVSSHTKNNPLLLDVDNDIEIDFDISNTGETIHLIDTSIEVYTIQKALFWDYETKIFKYNIDVDNGDEDGDGREGFDIVAGLAESKSLRLRSKDIEEYKELMRDQRARVDLTFNFETISDYTITVYIEEGVVSPEASNDTETDGNTEGISDNGVTQDTEYTIDLFDPFRGVETSQLILYTTASALLVSFVVMQTNKKIALKFAALIFKIGEMFFVIISAEAFIVAIGTVVRPPSIRNLKEDEVLTNDTRDRIYNYICSHEGAHFLEIINHIDIGPFEGTWHLQVLEDFGFIVSRRYKHYKIFYPLIPGKIIPLKDPRLVLKSKTAKAIVRFILKNPGAYQNLIAKKLGKSSGAIRYNMKKLVDAKIINIMKENGQNRFYINEKNLALRRILPENAFSV
ncbi:winged helix-turn-helix transcriptional regulator [Candidatus Borrarchaeum sp.]|uniref:winged helix-turn-helix transcriptional regulator n=1 Tax=Candidatus Borrarchaeum sp. TaxID=2846742 RepID=UPI0025806D72|nr:winged helix-turn-helix transcriptional regulator [Candidatus Borrarchaeum sp.]